MREVPANTFDYFAFELLHLGYPDEVRRFDNMVHVLAEMDNKIVFSGCGL